MIHVDTSGNGQENGPVEQPPCRGYFNDLDHQYDKSSPLISNLYQRARYASSEVWAAFKIVAAR